MAYRALPYNWGVMVKKRKEAITNEDLARLIHTEIGSLARSTAESFAEVHEKMDKGFADVDRRLIEVHDELGGIKGQVAGVNRRLDAIVDKHGSRLKRVEKHLGLAPLH